MEDDDETEEVHLVPGGDAAPTVINHKHKGTARHCTGVVTDSSRHKPFGVYVDHMGTTSLTYAYPNGGGETRKDDTGAPLVKLYKNVDGQLYVNGKPPVPHGFRFVTRLDHYTEKEKAAAAPVRGLVLASAKRKAVEKALSGSVDGEKKTPPQAKTYADEEGERLIASWKLQTDTAMALAREASVDPKAAAGEGEAGEWLAAALAFFKGSEATQIAAKAASVSAAKAGKLAEQAEQDADKARTDAEAAKAAASVAKAAADAFDENPRMTVEAAMKVGIVQHPHCKLNPPCKSECGSTANCTCQPPPDCMCVMCAFPDPHCTSRAGGTVGVRKSKRNTGYNRE